MCRLRNHTAADASTYIWFLNLKSPSPNRADPRDSDPPHESTLPMNGHPHPSATARGTLVGINVVEPSKETP